MLALYRKYRPKTLSEVVGQEALTTALENSIKSGKISHAYLFTGPRGTGKTSVARIFAHEINKFPYELEDSYLDIIEIDAASNTGVDNIRELREKAVIAPSQGKYKIYIIDEVHMLSKSAFNALLKTLEEPPEHVIFIMATTDAHKVPVTITSRSQVYTFSLASPEVMEKHLRKISDLEKIKISDGALKVLVRRGGGSFRDSLSLLDQISSLGDKNSEITEKTVTDALGLPEDALIEKILSAYESSATSSISSLLKETLNSGVKAETFAEEIIKKILENPSPVFFPLLEKLPSVSAPYPEAKLLLALLATAPNSPQPLQTVVQKTVKIEAQKTIVETAPTPVKTEFSARSEVPQNNSQNTPQFEPNKPQAEPETLPERPSSFDQGSFLDAVKLANPAISQQLLRCQISLDGSTLNLYPDKKIIKTILTRPNNREILTSNLPENVELVVHDPEEASAKIDPALAKISDIMGGDVKEVDNGGGIPF